MYVRKIAALCTPVGHVATSARFSRWSCRDTTEETVLHRRAADLGGLMSVWSCVGDPATPGACGTGNAGELVGRARESAELARLLAAHRLVTVTGRAGVGKSRLAAAVGARWPMVQVHGQGDCSAALTQAPSTGLLLLDDVDPVHRATVGRVRRLLDAAPGLRVLVTARQALGLGEERVLRLPPLTATGPDVPPAVDLFLRRARAASDGFRAEGPDLRAVERICRSLEGVPLALELAAEQLAFQRVGDLAAVLEVHQCWLHGEGPALRRHRSLRATVGASYALCEREARIVWGRASVLAGAFDESTASFLCGGGGVEPHQVPSLLAGLAAIHVLEPVRDPGGPRPPRYRMTRAARDFGAERLRAAGECETALERRATHARQLAGTAQYLWASGRQDQAVALVQEEQEELTAVLNQAVHRPDQGVTALRTVVGLWFWWAVYGHGEQGLDYLLRLLPLCPEDNPASRRGRWLAAWLSARRDPQAARVLLGPAWPQAVLAGDDTTIGQIAHVQGLIALHEGDPRGAAAHFAESARTLPARPDYGPSPAVALATRAVTQTALAPDAARRTAHRALSRREIRDDAWGTLLARYAMAYVDHHQGRDTRAARRARRTLATLDRARALPHGHEALRALITDIESGTRDRHPLPSLPRPRGASTPDVPTEAASGSARH
ncbi:hypothetical protein Stsp02_27030 [Streptomyces sp. NBRC 14336]|nr:hypothetical protein Stsp02_27030 [Streptomyces sp. NBRC 14336]